MRDISNNPQSQHQQVKIVNKKKQYIRVILWALAIGLIIVLVRIGIKYFSR